MRITCHHPSLEIPADAHRATRRGERGYALLGLLLALSIMSIFLVSSVVPNVKMQVQREKEIEMIYRGNQMAKAIARYYGVRALRPLQLQVPPPYGYLTELKKLRDGVIIGVQEVKFARPSEVIDPMTGDEWEPVRARDPRINGVLQAFAAETGAIIPPSYLLLAGAPTKTRRIVSGSSDSDSESSSKPETRPGQPAGGVNVRRPANPNNELDDDDDDDDDEAINDPLAHLFEKDSNSSFGSSGESSSGSPGKSTIPIIGVAPKRKGKALRPLYGLENYEEWVFIYIPDTSQSFGPGNSFQNPNQNPNQRGGASGGTRVSP